MISLPIIVLETGDLSVFSNEKELDAELEAIDVHDKRYVAYDATGRRLRFEVAADERITVTEDPAGVQDPRALEQALRSHLAATRREAPPQTSLGELVWIAGSKDLERLRQDSKRSRRRAAWRLGESTDVRLVPSLIDVLDDEDSKLVEAAASALGTLGDRRAVEPLAHLLESCDEWVRLTAATALAEIGDARGEPILLPRWQAWMPTSRSPRRARWRSSGSAARRRC